MPYKINSSDTSIDDNGLYDAYSDDISKQGRFIMLTNKSEYYSNSTLVHEIGHTLGLLHSFQKEELDGNSVITPKHSFEEGKTDNIMDYLRGKDVMYDIRKINKIKTFFKWQWKIMQNDNIDLIPENL